MLCVRLPCSNSCPHTVPCDRQIFFAYIGFDAVATSAEEVNNPKKDLPLGILGALGVVTLCYILLSLALVMMVPMSALTESASFAAAFAYVGLPWAQYIVALGERGHHNGAGTWKALEEITAQYRPDRIAMNLPTIWSTFRSLELSIQDKKAYHWYAVKLFAVVAGLFAVSAQGAPMRCLLPPAR